MAAAVDEDEVGRAGWLWLARPDGLGRRAGRPRGRLVGPAADAAEQREERAATRRLAAPQAALARAEARPRPSRGRGRRRSGPSWPPSRRPGTAAEARAGRAAGAGRPARDRAPRRRPQPEGHRGPARRAGHPAQRGPGPHPARSRPSCVRWARPRRASPTGADRRETPAGPRRRRRRRRRPRRRSPPTRRPDDRAPVTGPPSHRAGGDARRCRSPCPPPSSPGSPTPPAAAASLADALAAVAEALERPARPPAPRRRRCRRRGRAPVRSRPSGAPGRHRRASTGPARAPGAAGLPGGVFDDSVEAAEHLLRTPGAVLVVDGYNVTMTGWPELHGRRAAPPAGRGGVRPRPPHVDRRSRWCSTGPRSSRSPVPAPVRALVRVRFSDPGVEADDVIIDLVGRIPAATPVIVASSDNRVRARAPPAWGQRAPRPPARRRCCAAESAPDASHPVRRVARGTDVTRPCWSRRCHLQETPRATPTHRPAHAGGPTAPLTIDCDECAMQGTERLRRLRGHVHLLARAGRGRWSSTWPRSGRCGCCPAPACCPSCATSAAPAERARPASGRLSCRRGRCRHDGPVPTAVLPPRRVPAVDELVAAGRAAGLDAVGVTAAAPFATTRRHLADRKAAGLHGGMQFTYRNPTRSTDPTPRPARRPRPRRRAPALPPRAPATPPATGRPARSAAWPATPGTTTTGRCGRRSRAVARAAQGRRLAGPGRWPTTTPSSTGRPPTGPASAGTARTPTCCCPGEGSWFVLGSVRHRRAARRPAAAPVADGCGTCTRCLDGCPTGAIVAPGVVDARRCLAWLLQATGPFPREHRVALGDRIYGCDDCQEVCPPNRRAERPVGRRRAPRPARATRPWVDVLDLLGADRRRAARPPRALVHPRPRSPATCAATPWWCWATSATAPTRAVVDRPAPLPWPTPTRCSRAHAVWAARRLGRDDLVLAAGVAHDADPLVRAELAAPVDAAPSRRGARRP